MTGGKVVLSEGRFNLAAIGITLKSNLTLSGQGESTELFLINSANGRMIRNTAAISNVVFEDMVFNGNGVNQSDGASRDDRSILMLDLITGFTVRGCTIKNGRHGAALRLDRCDRTLLQGNKFLDNAVAGAGHIGDHNFNRNADWFRVIGNYYENASDTGTAQDGIQHSTVIGNTYNNCALGISVCNSTDRISRDNVVGYNTIKGKRGDTGTSEFTSAGPNAALTDSDKIWVVDEWKGNDVTSGASSMEITGNSTTELHGTWVGGTPAPGSYGIGSSVGIKVSTFNNTAPGNMKDVVVGNNTVESCDRAMWVEEVDRCTVYHNNFRDASGRNKQLLLLGGSVGGVANIVRILQNQFYNTTARAISFATNGTLNKVRILDNEFDTCTAPAIGGTIPSDCIIRGLPGSGWVTQNSGAVSVADGGTITHGLSATPTKVRVTGSQGTPSNFISVTALGATTFVVNIKTTAGTPGTTQTIYWEAEV